MCRRAVVQVKLLAFTPLNLPGRAVQLQLHCGPRQYAKRRTLSQLGSLKSRLGVMVDRMHAQLGARLAPPCGAARRADATIQGWGALRVYTCICITTHCTTGIHGLRHVIAFALWGAAPSPRGCAQHRSACRRIHYTSGSLMGQVSIDQLVDGLVPSGSPQGRALAPHPQRAAWHGSRLHTANTCSVQCLACHAA